MFNEKTRVAEDLLGELLSFLQKPSLKKCIPTEVIAQSSEKLSRNHGNFGTWTLSHWPEAQLRYKMEAQDVGWELWVL